MPPLIGTTAVQDLGAARGIIEVSLNHVVKAGSAESQ